VERKMMKEMKEKREMKERVRMKLQSIWARKDRGTTLLLRIQRKLKV